MTSLVIFQAEADAHGWLQRRLQPSNSLTPILAQQIWYDGDTPKTGDRLPQFDNESNDSPTTHWTPGNWVVDRVDVYKVDASSAMPQVEHERICYCHCVYAPIDQEWYDIKQLEAVVA